MKASVAKRRHPGRVNINVESRIVQPPSLTSLVYVSSAAHSLTLAEIDHLLMRARARNVEQGVTGVLLYNSGNFMQYLEGPPTGIDTVYTHIVRDPLHSGIIEIIREPITTREFGEWSMAFRSNHLVGVSEPYERDAALLQRIVDAASGGSPARALLGGFWLRSR